MIIDLVRGALGGCLSTIPMTWFMDAVHRRLPRKERYPLPPRQIAMRMAQRMGFQNALGKKGRFQFTLLSHFAMGTAAGGLYGVLSPGFKSRSPLAATKYGLAVWAANYLLLLPVAHILRPATEHPPRRTALMIGAHLVWGICLGLLVPCSRRR